MQQKLKSRMAQHFNDTTNLINKGFKSNSFATHFSKQHRMGKGEKTTIINRYVTQQGLTFCGKKIQFLVANLLEN